MTLRCVEDDVQCTPVNGMKVIFGLSVCSQKWRAVAYMID